MGFLRRVKRCSRRHGIGNEDIIKNYKFVTLTNAFNRPKPIDLTHREVKRRVVSGQRQKYISPVDDETSAD